MATRTPGRIVLSKNPKENLDLAKIIFAKHVSLGAASPLAQLDGIDLNAANAQVGSTLTLHEAAENFKRQMEESYRQRDAQLESIVLALKKSIALLKATYATNPKKLGEWGINVDDSKSNNKKPQH